MGGHKIISKSNIFIGPTSNTKMAFNENNEEYMEGFCTECCCTLYGDDAYDMFCDDCEAEQDALAREATFGGLITARESFLNNNSNVNPDLPYNEGGWMKS